MGVPAFIVLNAKNNYMKKILPLILALSALASCKIPEPISDVPVQEVKQEKASGTNFVNERSDIPLEEGLAEIDDNDIGFDSPSGSISTNSYKSLDLDKTRAFYIKTLPHLGWKLAKNDDIKLTFTREKEKVEIEFVNKDGQDIVRFFISAGL